MSLRGELAEHGYCGVDFDLSEADRAEYTAVASRVIDLAQTEPRVQEALTFHLIEELPGKVDPTLNPTKFTVSPALNSGDKKVWLHAGYQSRERADAVMPERNQPAELRELWSSLEDVLDANERAARQGFEALGFAGLSEVIFHPNRDKRVVLVRTVKYLGSLDAPAGHEVGEGHTDQFIATGHLYETHHGWCLAVPFPQEVMEAPDDTPRQLTITTMRELLTPITVEHGRQVALLLGAGIANLPAELRGNLGLSELAACYHAIFRPAPEDEQVSPYAEAISDTDRVTTIVFMHANTDILSSGEYRFASLKQCRPKAIDVATAIAEGKL